MQTILDSADRPAHDAFVEKKSEFIGDTCHIDSLDDALAFVAMIREKLGRAYPSLFDRRVHCGESGEQGEDRTVRGIPDSAGLPAARQLPESTGVSAGRAGRRAVYGSHRNACDRTAGACRDL